ncbi:uncharacterized protein EV422DRAFT_134538 [Fimicolochytrium jonesii]|uniref:uncharacterized protein n=1 Tax=Fimicolochytrium jonesii TaxID=1396493 RepID=UPI0022FF0362|nr:uncharacterized protein EV422DRAFT_134538 [Fimicolochytrium jonesii]KAI8825638.1 hypothetical protein EV422DRAFT_134538 [Fimicolochytrium jonesii]
MDNQPSPSPTSNATAPIIPGRPTFVGYPNPYGSKVDTSIEGTWIWFLIACAVSLLSVGLYELVRQRHGLRRVLYTRTETNRLESPHIPTEWFGWFKPVWNIPESYIAENVGLDAVMFLRFMRMCFTIIAILTCVLIPILIPVNYYADRSVPPPPNPSGNSTAQGINKASLDRYSLANIPEGSPSLWAHVVCAYMVSFVAYHIMFISYREYAKLATEYIYAGSGWGNKRPPAWRKGELLQLRSVMLRNLPPELQTEESLKTYLEGLEIGSIEKVVIDRDPSNIVSKLYKQRERALKQLERAYVEWLKAIHLERQKRLGKRQRVFFTPGTLLRVQAAPLNLQEIGLDEFGMIRLRPKSRKRRREKVCKKKGDTSSFGAENDRIEYYSKKLTALTIKLKYLRQVGSTSHPIVAETATVTTTNAAGFVTFGTQRSAQIAAQVLLHDSDSYFPMSVTLAPPPQDVVWENLSISAWRRFVQSWAITGLCFVLTFFWIIPTAAVASLTSIDSLARLPAFKDFFGGLDKNSPQVYLIVTKIGPALVVNLVNLVVPIIFEFLSYRQGIYAHSQVEIATMSKYFFFLLFNIFFVFSVAQTIIQVAAEFLRNPISIVNLTVSLLPSAASFYITYIILNLMMFPLELLRPGVMLLQFIGRWVCQTPRDFHGLSILSSSLNYGMLYPIHVLIFVIVICYSTIAPIILVPGSLYFALGWFVFRNQLLFVYVKEWESYGYHWVLAFHRCTVGLGIYQVLIVGLLALKNSPTASALCAPLVGFTIVFHIYCRKIFGKRSHLIPLDRFSKTYSVGSDPGSHLHPTNGRDGEYELTPIDSRPSNEISHRKGSLATNASSFASLERRVNDDQSDVSDQELEIVTSAEQHAADRYPTSYRNPVFSKPLPRPWLPVSMAAWWGLPPQVGPRPESASSKAARKSGSFPSTRGSVERGMVAQTADDTSLPPDVERNIPSVEEAEDVPLEAVPLPHIQIDYHHHTATPVPDDETGHMKPSASDASLNMVPSASMESSMNLIQR